MVWSTAAKVAIGVGVLATVGLVGGGVARAAKKLRDARRKPLPEPERQWTSEGEYVSAEGLAVSWRTYLVDTGEHGAVYEVADVDSADLCCYPSGPEALGAVLELWPDEEPIDEEAIAQEFGASWSHGSYRALDEGWIPAAESFYDEDLHWVLYRDLTPFFFETEYAVLWSVGGTPVTATAYYPTIEQAMWDAMDEIKGPPWMQDCPGVDAYLTEHPHAGEIWYCPSAPAGSTVARGWFTGDSGLSAEWRVQKTANPQAPYVAQYRGGLDPLDTEERSWTFVGDTDLNVDAVAWAYKAAKEAV